MIGTDPDRELVRLFQEVRRLDEASAPGFREILTRSPAAPVSRRPYLFAAFAGALVVALTLGGVLLSRRPPVTGVQDSIALGDWRSSTDALLRTPGGQLLDSVPALPGPVPDYSAIAGALDRQDPKPTRSPKGARS